MTCAAGGETLDPEPGSRDQLHLHSDLSRCSQVLNPSCRSGNSFCLVFNHGGFLVLSCWISLCVLDINSFSDLWLVDPSSHPVGWLSGLLMVSFAAPEFLV